MLPSTFFPLSLPGNLIMFGNNVSFSSCTKRVASVSKTRCWAGPSLCIDWSSSEYAEETLCSKVLTRGSSADTESLRCESMETIPMSLWNTSEHSWKARHTQKDTHFTFGPASWPIAYSRWPSTTLLPFLNLVNKNYLRTNESTTTLGVAARRGQGGNDE